MCTRVFFFSLVWPCMNCRRPFFRGPASNVVVAVPEAPPHALPVSSPIAPSDVSVPPPAPPEVVRVAELFALTACLIAFMSLSFLASVCV
jgi:hypothetical protein